MGTKEYVVLALEEHHRRPRSIGGTSDKGNLSYVTPSMHRAWHAMFGNFNVFQIVDRLNTWVMNDSRKEIYQKFINGRVVTKSGKNACKNRKKFLENWEWFYAENEYDIEKTLAYINNTWLDPSYHLYMRRKRKH